MSDDHKLLSKVRYRIAEDAQGEKIEGSPWALRYDVEFDVYRLDHLPTGQGGVIRGTCVRSREIGLRILNRLHAAAPAVGDHDEKDPEQAGKAWGGIFRTILREEAPELPSLVDMRVDVLVDSEGRYSVSSEKAVPVEQLVGPTKRSLLFAAVPLPPVSRPHACAVDPTPPSPEDEG